MVIRIDRLARRIGDLQDFVRAVKANGASLNAIDQPIDTSTAASKCFPDASPRKYAIHEIPSFVGALSVRYRARESSGDTSTSQKHGNVIWCVQRPTASHHNFGRIRPVAVNPLGLSRGGFHVAHFYDSDQFSSTRRLGRHRSCRGQVHVAGAERSRVL
jgi:hypothetical protein